jgi:hypothetical protein
MKLRNLRERLRLQRLIEEVASDLFRLKARGLFLHVEQIETRGRIPTIIRAWAKLHFLPKGSPFCCMEPTCHLFVDPTLPHPIADEIRRRLRLRQSVEFRFADVHPIVHDGVQLDSFNGATPVPADINQQDQLGRTALWRAAARGYEHQVESLIESGADPNIPGPNGRTPLDHARKNDEAGGGYLTHLLEQDTSRLKRGSRTRHID